ncbi:MAG TPA: hypothetical protein VHC71_13925 [Hyphomicrobium sp.]|nr:hypothetical protein [Hyphomicrobium sp.]
MTGGPGHMQRTYTSGARRSQIRNLVVADVKNLGWRNSLSPRQSIKCISCALRRLQVCAGVKIIENMRPTMRINDRQQFDTRHGRITQPDNPNARTTAAFYLRHDIRVRPYRMYFDADLRGLQDRQYIFRKAE